jgi:hypothetical protein
MQTLYGELGGDPSAVPPTDEMDTQGWWWHEVFLFLGGDPNLQPSDNCTDIFGFWLQQINIGFGGDPSAWPPEDFEDVWGWWFQQICATLGNDPFDWPPSDELDCLNWWMLKLIALSAGGWSIPLQFYQQDGDLYVAVTEKGRRMGVAEDQFEIDDESLSADTPIDDKLNRDGDDIAYDGE